MAEHLDETAAGDEPVAVDDFCLYCGEPLSPESGTCSHPELPPHPVEGLEWR
jgi:hypothetical protein